MVVLIYLGGLFLISKREEKREQRTYNNVNNNNNPAFAATIECKINNGHCQNDDVAA
jgi:hypothetical protein